MNSLNMDELISWLVSGDVTIQFQTKRDLMESTPLEIEKLQRQISLSGWGKAFMEIRDDDTGKWGNGWYSPKPFQDQLRL